MGSVKDLEVVKGPTRDVMGVGRFHFSDRYSVFDWGEMPDRIDCKGEALCLMGAYCFEKLEEAGVRSHYSGLVDEKGRVVRFRELCRPSSTMEVGLVNVYRPEARSVRGKIEYDYGVYASCLRNCLIPLEVIYRNGLPEGSSVFRRLEEGKSSLNDFGLDHYPRAGERFVRPIFDVSTKLEDTDRYVTWAEAQRLSGLADSEVVAVKGVLAEVDGVVSGLAGRAGLVNEDGKIELAFDEFRRIMVVDVVGTLDECRFTYEGVHVSKEVARQFYRKTRWYLDVEEAKRFAEAHGIREWRGLCRSQPPLLDLELKVLIGEMYMAAANDFTGCRLFDVPVLGKVIKKYRDYMSDLK
jgi:phosphoribosylaminoimidazole-succinocarboxamide synthase